MDIYETTITFFGLKNQFQYEKRACFFVLEVLRKKSENAFPNQLNQKKCRNINQIYRWCENKSHFLIRHTFTMLFLMCVGKLTVMQLNTGFPLYGNKYHRFEQKNYNVETIRIYIYTVDVFTNQCDFFFRFSSYSNIIYHLSIRNN